MYYVLAVVFILAFYTVAWIAFTDFTGPRGHPDAQCTGQGPRSVAGSSERTMNAPSGADEVTALPTRTRNHALPTTLQYAFAISVVVVPLSVLLDFVVPTDFTYSVARSIMMSCVTVLIFFLAPAVIAHYIARAWLQLAERIGLGD